MDIAKRIQLVRMDQHPKLTQTEFGERLGVSKDVVANLEYGRVTPSESIVKLMCVTFNLNALWLKEGYGEMYLTPDTGEEMVSRIMAGENDFAKSIIKAFARLEDEDWQQLEEIVNKLKGASC
ncbi:MAG: helix-turn-helix transcriptional regulator [Clostridia bacterium]